MCVCVGGCGCVGVGVSVHLCVCVRVCACFGVFLYVFGTVLALRSMVLRATSTSGTGSVTYTIMMIAFITIKSSLVPLIEGLCAQI